ncbi:MAG: exo-beta-N-acetylmuramidase NamZ domain-containing protein [Muribaculaceae bacterium]
MKRLTAVLLLIISLIGVSAQDVIVGAACTDEYVPKLKGKRIALLSNHTGMVGEKHTLDIMLESGLNVTTIFSPEHGFRGKADAGEHVGSSVDPVTGIPIASLYDGKTRMPSQKVMDGFDVIVTDIQDVGLRYYTYYCTMIDLMNAAAKYGKEFMVLDRPNPNGMYVDGPILDMKYESGVGRLPIPIVHGMTLGEIAKMANGVGWLKEGKKVALTVITCKNYTHATRYELPIAPSPNLKTMHAIYLYPSTCYFEATPVSLGRGTDSPFEIYGHPDMAGYSFSFVPQSVEGAKNPPQLGNLCHGRDLRGIEDEKIISAGVNLEYVIDAYNHLGLGEKFFTSFFEKLIGRGDIRKMIMDGKSASEIKATWADDVKKFKAQRKPYLLYAE